MGRSAVVGASVQLYSAGTGGNGSAPTPLLSTPLTTDANGSFSLAAGAYGCPATTSLLYAVASGGAVGTGPVNSAISLMTVPGVCGNLVSGSSFVANEVTTAAGVYAFRPFLLAGAQLGASATNSSGLALGAATMANLINLSAGSAPGPGFPSNGAAPVGKLNSVANLLHVCAGSAGPTSNGCAALFNATASGSVVPANTLDAALSLVDSPGTEVTALYNLSTEASVFAPYLLSAPPDWTLPVSFTGGGLSEPATVAIDGAGLVWVVNYGGVASLFSNIGAPVYPNGITGYGLDESYGAAVDNNGVLWAANTASTSGVNGGVGSITLLNSAGPALPGSSQYTAGGINQPLAIAIDGTGVAWIVSYYNNNVLLLSNAGVPLSGDAGYFSQQFGFPTAIAVDSQRNGWVANFESDAGTVTEFNAGGTSFTSYSVGAGPNGIAIDAKDNVWSANYVANSVGLVSGGKVLSGATGFSGGGLDHPQGIVTDGNGTVWVANYRAPGISQMAGASATVPGAAISPSAGWAPDVNLMQAYSIAIDAAGNLWVTSNADNRLVEYVGLAAPVKTPLLGATRIP